MSTKFSVGNSNERIKKKVFFEECVDGLRLVTGNSMLLRLTDEGEIFLYSGIRELEFKRDKFGRLIVVKEQCLVSV